MKEEEVQLTSFLILKFLTPYKTWKGWGDREEKSKVNEEKNLEKKKRKGHFDKGYKISPRVWGDANFLKILYLKENTVQEYVTTV